jgi:hypothetical protein
MAVARRCFYGACALQGGVGYGERGLCLIFALLLLRGLTSAAGSRFGFNGCQFRPLAQGQGCFIRYELNDLGFQCGGDRDWRGVDECDTRGEVLQALACVPGL